MLIVQIDCEAITLLEDGVGDTAGIEDTTCELEGDTAGIEDTTCELEGDTAGIDDTTCELEGDTVITGLEEGDGIGLMGGAGVGGLKISPVSDMINGTPLFIARPCFEQSTNRFTYTIKRVEQLRPRDLQTSSEQDQNNWYENVSV